MPTNVSDVVAQVTALGSERDSESQRADATQQALDQLRAEYDAHMAEHHPPEPPPEPEPEPTRKLGIYNGNPSEDPDAKSRTLLGSYPDVTYTYLISQALDLTYETARVQRGTWVMIGVDTKGTPGLLTRIAQREATGLDWLRSRLRAAQQVAEAGASAGGRVVLNFCHEWEVKLAKGIWTNPSDADQANYVRAHDVFVAEARSLAPDCDVIYVCGGWGGNRPRIGQIIDAFTEPVVGVGWDPYVTSNTDPAATATALFSSFADWLKGQPFYQPAWELWVPEFGYYRNHGAQPMAAFYSGVAEAMDAVGIAAAILFNRNPGDTHQWKIDTVPEAVAAFRGEVEQVRA